MKKSGEEGKQNVYLIIFFLKPTRPYTASLQKRDGIVSCFLCVSYTLRDVYKWRQETIKNVGVKCRYNFLVSYKMHVFFAVISKIVIFFGFLCTHL